MKKLVISAGIILIACAVSLCSLCVMNCRAQTVASGDDADCVLIEAEPVICNYTAVRIRPGDTLNTIEQQYNAAGAFSSEEYISELMRINTLYTDTIHAGNFLTVIIY